MTKAIFQAGFSWQVIRNKWDNFKNAFHGFDIEVITDYGLTDLERLVTNKHIVRNKNKIAATLENARIMKSLVAQHGSFKDYLNSLEGDYYHKATELTKTFAEVSARWTGKTSIKIFYSKFSNHNNCCIQFELFL